MKFNISLLSITLCASLFASDEQPQRGLAATLARLRANRGRTEPEIQRKHQSAPSARDLVKAAQNDSPKDFEKTLRSFLDNNPGCITWDESCESACPKSDKEIDWDTDVSSMPGFDQPITCKDYLGSCYRNLRGCPAEELDAEIKKTCLDLTKGKTCLEARCKAIGLICQGADANTQSNNMLIAPLHIAAHINDYSFAQFLLSHNASVNVVHDEKNTPLHFSMVNPGSAQTTRVLIANKADVQAQDNDGLTPLMKLALSCYHYSGISNIIDKAKLLFSAGAKTHHRATDGRFKGYTAYEIAGAKKFAPACQALADYIQAHEKQQSRIQE